MRKLPSWETRFLLFLSECQMDFYHFNSQFVCVKMIENVNVMSLFSYLLSNRDAPRPFLSQTQIRKPIKSLLLLLLLLLFLVFTLTLSVCPYILYFLNSFPNFCLLSPHRLFLQFLPLFFQSLHLFLSCSFPVSSLSPSFCWFSSKVALLTD